MTRTDVFATPAGRVTLESGTRADYLALAAFHYKPAAPATAALIARAVFALPRACGLPRAWRRRTVGVAVLSWPIPLTRGRSRRFCLDARRYGACLRFANAHVRTVSRVVVHPQFRALGLAGQLVRHLAARCPTRFVEASSALARACPFFESAGFAKHDAHDGGPAYFLLDKNGAT